MFDWTFTPAEAQLAFGLFVSVLVPFVVSLIKRYVSDRGLRVLIALLVSVVGAVLSQYAAGELSGGSVVVAAIGIFTAAQAHFATWFQSLGIDGILSGE